MSYDDLKKLNLRMGDELVLKRKFPNLEKRLQDENVRSVIDF